MLIMVRLKDKNGTLLDYRPNNQGAVITKGKRTVYLLFQTVNQGKKARLLVASNSFDVLFKKGKKIKLLGPNVSHIKVV